MNTSTDMVFDISDTRMLDTLFPFHFFLGPDLQMVTKGKSLAKLLPEGDRFETCFDVIRPGMGMEMEFDSIASYASQIFILRLKTGKKGMVLKGQFIVCPNKYFLLFCGSPWMVSENSFRESGLMISDFAIHDSLIDLLHHFKSEHMAMDDMRSLNIQLKDKNRELEQLNRDLDHFVYSASHDLRAPALAIEGIVEELESEPNDNEKKQKSLQLIRRVVRRIDDTITDIINYSKNSRLPVSHEAIDLQLIATEIFDSMKHLKKHPINFSVDIDAACALNSDRLRVHSLLRNLISNAIKFSVNRPEGSNISITGVVKNHHCQLRVADNGEGIPEEFKDHVFDMFFRGTTTSYGSGLGLYICHEIMRKLGGKIQFESEPNKGTTFIIEFPNNTSNG
ncbi:MAG: ATP-binding protein [Bacteroidota bacterium]